jgi:2-keto-4-pentenoate hydratase/2-oxohepta-3-ene-1,7-dioic acid hydratase in catechol pathway
MQTSQWTAGKALDTFAPCGPALVTADEIADVQDLDIRTRLNGEEVQSSNTSLMLFPVRTLISFISSLMTLEPGDVIATGTPSGVGFTREPPLVLKPGDRVEVEIEAVGLLQNPVVGS